MGALSPTSNLVGVVPRGWAVQRYAEPPGSFHARPVPTALDRSVWVCDPTEPALVLGSTQSDELVDRAACRRAGVEVVRRRSGGGAVHVEPSRLLWVDVLIPASDPLWDRDVARAFVWLGEAWAAALMDLGVDAVVHRGGPLTTRWSTRVCFAGLGSGEVTTSTGAKLVGISQRRTRPGARFQCAALAQWDPARLIDLLVLDPSERAAACSDLEGAATGVGVDLDALLEAFLDRLP